MNKQHYRQLISSAFISEPIAKYNMLRASTELAEEFFELLAEEQRELQLKELGDIYFWLTWLSIELDFDLCPEYISPNTIVCVKNVIGSIKRIYRDNNNAKLIELPALINQLLASLLAKYNVAETDIMKANYAKINRRLNNGTIQGEGTR